MKESNRRYHEQNAEKRNAYQAKYRAENPEKVKALIARWYLNNMEKSKAVAAAYQTAHPERRKEYQARYQGKYPEVHRATQQTRRAKKRGQWVEDVDHAVVWKRDGGICHICKEPADRNKWHLDHVIPLAIGGEHSYANTAVSHPVCNIRKGARPL